jgi:selenocysteine-specific translation elongation factor
LEGTLVGVFGANPSLKTSFLSSIGKKSETEGIIVYQRNEAGKRYSLLDDGTFPERIQGYARIASICDYALYSYPPEGKLSPPDGELAVLCDAFALDGTAELIDGSIPDFGTAIKTSFKGLKVSTYRTDTRDSKSSVINLSAAKARGDYPAGTTLVYIDRAFNVKGVGLVVLGFVLAGTVSLHDKLRLLPNESGKFAEVKGIQVSDEDQESAGRGIRIGLSLKNVELKDFSKVSWMDNGSTKTISEVEFDFRRSPYYKQPVADRDLHLEANGELLVAHIVKGPSPTALIAKLTAPIPVWGGMPVCVLDLNSKALRIAGGGTAKS